MQDFFHQRYLTNMFLESRWLPGYLLVMPCQISFLDSARSMQHKLVSRFHYRHWCFTFYRCFLMLMPTVHPHHDLTYNWERQLVGSTMFGRTFQLDVGDRGCVFCFMKIMTWPRRNGHQLLYLDLLWGDRFFLLSTRNNNLETRLFLLPSRKLT